MSVCRTRTKMHFYILISGMFSLSAINTGCLSERDASDSQNNNLYANSEHDHRFDNSSDNNDANAGSNSDAGENPCGGSDSLFYEGQQASPQEPCGLCGEGVLECVDENTLQCSGELIDSEQIPGESCDDGFVWTCTESGTIECQPDEDDTDVVFITPDFQDIEADFGVDSNSATLRGGIGHTPPRAVIVSYGFCWGRVPEPSIELADEDLAQCESLEITEDLENFELHVDDLLPGRTYYVRTFVQTENNVYYADTISFTTDAPAVENVSAEQPQETPAITVMWEPIEGADEYIIFRDGNEIARVAGQQDSYDDHGAQSGAIPSTPSNVEATTIYDDKVIVSWDASTASPGTDHEYTIQAVYPDADSPLSEPAFGQIEADENITYEVLINGTWQSVGIEFSYEDFQASPNELSDFIIVASQGESADYVALSIDELPVINTVETIYQVRAVNSLGHSEPSDSVSGHLASDSSDFEFQWQRSLNDDDDDYSAIMSATDIEFNDVDAPESGEGRYYRLLISGPGVTAHYSWAVRGFRAAPAIFANDTSATVSGSSVVVQATVAFVGAPNSIEHGFCYGMSATPSHDGNSICTTLGDIAQAGVISQNLGGITNAGTYYVRPYAENIAGVAYGSVATFYKLPATPQVTASNMVNAVEIHWNNVNGADRYAIYRDGEFIAEVQGNQTFYRDSNASPGSVPTAPSIVGITQGDDVNGVGFSWTASSTSAGNLHTYNVVAITADGLESNAGTAEGQREARSVSEYQIRVGNDGWQTATTSSGLSYFDGDSPKASVLLGTGGVSASDMTSGEYSTLTVDVASLQPPASQAYSIRAINAAGSSAISTMDGYRGYDTNYTIQWYYSDTPSDSASFAPLGLSCENDATCNDTTAPTDGSYRSYYVEISGDGIETYISDVVEGALDPCPGTAFLFGDGSALDPYTVCNAAQLNSIGADASLWDKHFIQTRDIDLATLPDGTPFNIIGDNNTGDSASRFVGAFDGNGFIISNLTLDLPGQEYVGLFGYVENGQLSEVALRDVDIVGGNIVGGLVAWIAGGTVSESSATGVLQGDSRIGGLIGAADATTITESHTDITVTIEGEDATNVMAGGLAGAIFAGSTVTDCYTTGDVNAHIQTGGLLGYMYGASEISDSYSVGMVSGDDRTGGLVGEVHENSLINRSYTTGDVYGTSQVAGLVGLMGQYTISGGVIETSYATGSVHGGYIVGGLIGNQYRTIARYSYATGDVVGDMYVGGFTGMFQGSNGLIEESYATGHVSGRQYVGGLAGEQWVSATIRRSFAVGDVTGIIDDNGDFLGDIMGGLVGLMHNAVTDDSYALGNVDGVSRVGGLYGRRSNTNNHIRTSYALGNVSGTTDVGYFVGEHLGGTISTYNYFYRDALCDGCPQPVESNYGIGLTAAEMALETSYEDLDGSFDFDTIWTMSSCGIPRFRWQPDDVLVCGQ